MFKFYYLIAKIYHEVIKNSFLKYISFWFSNTYLYAANLSPSFVFDILPISSQKLEQDLTSHSIEKIPFFSLTSITGINGFLALTSG